MTDAHALLEKLAPYARSVLQEHLTRNKSDSAYHTRRIDGTGLTYGALRKIVELVDAGKCPHCGTNCRRPAGDTCMGPPRPSSKPSHGMMG